MVEISSSGSGGGPGRVTSPGYPTRPPSAAEHEHALAHANPTPGLIPLNSPTTTP
jgi:hypothetical protein